MSVCTTGTRCLSLARKAVPCVAPPDAPYVCAVSALYAIYLSWAV